MSSMQCPWKWLMLIVAGLSMLGGCSTFERDWEARASLAAADGSPAEGGNEHSPSGLEGRWRGTWHSDQTGHSGDLRCIITPQVPDDATPGDLPDTYLARYHATYAGFMTFEYELVMHVTREAETYRFSAATDLGWLAGGRYEYEGTVVGDEFRSTYTSKGDHGTFEMQRLDANDRTSTTPDLTTKDTGPG